MAASVSPHDRSSKLDDEDPVDSMLRKTGCLDKHYEVQMCMFEHKDWRKCQNELSEFRQCIQAYEQKRKITAIT